MYSRSALQSIDSMNQRSPTFMFEFNVLKPTLSANTLEHFIAFQWVPGYSAIPGERICLSARENRLVSGGKRGVQRKNRVEASDRYHRRFAIRRLASWRQHLRETLTGFLQPTPLLPTASLLRFVWISHWLCPNSFFQNVIWRPYLRKPPTIYGVNHGSRISRIHPYSITLNAISRSLQQHPILKVSTQLPTTCCWSVRISLLGAVHSNPEFSHPSFPSCEVIEYVGQRCSALTLLHVGEIMIWHSFPEISVLWLTSPNKTRAYSTVTNIFKLIATPWNLRACTESWIHSPLADRLGLNIFQLLGGYWTHEPGRALKKLWECSTKAACLVAHPLIFHVQILPHLIA